MSKPPFLCTCGKAVPHGTLCACKKQATRERNRRHDANRPTARQRGYSRAWERERDLWLAHHPDCNFCGKPATLVDHIIAHKGDQSLFWDWRNWQSLCTTCHNRHKQRLERSRDV
jgi:5-methylcytosine-specific restriction enzyme A